MPFPDQADDLTRARVAPEGALGKDEGPVDGHLEHAS
jgi:hypothetical protein